MSHVLPILRGTETGSEPVQGRTVIDSLDWQIHVAEGAATGATMALTGAIGLVEIIDRFRFRASGAPIPVPGAYEIPAHIRERAGDAMDAVATCRVLTEEIAREDAAGVMGDERRARLVAEVADASAQAQSASMQARRHLRHLCQIALGVAQFVEHDDIELVERAATGVLNHDDTATPATTDRIPLAGRTHDEVAVELAGLLARLLFDHASGNDADPRFTISAGRTEVAVAITPTGAIEVQGGDRFVAPARLADVAMAIGKKLADGPIDEAVLSWPTRPHA